ncbi:hypothetical protein IscW_ISCW013354 [Ixodes scapularis]|uniref:Uncharacterized protein n=1 Tax=Ixodes scapularis TaxID=6945 RepID=B7QG06_IXOSC|nr:hypothetical protein IscW_ISCW013354 [Ixodes scapularis]|eukprot:XP_002401081.1 hypothetical protein IscW_ISCW013354 [Ixodes scapularis]
MSVVVVGHYIIEHRRGSSLWVCVVGLRRMSSSQVVVLLRPCGSSSWFVVVLHSLPSFDMARPGCWSSLIIFLVLVHLRSLSSLRVFVVVFMGSLSMGNRYPYFHRNVMYKDS